MALDQPRFDAPIPGMSMTAELGARPWQSPPQYATVDEAIEYYLDRMSSDDFLDQLTDVMEMGIPITTIANTMQLGNVMEGVHTVDVGMLIMPVLVEMMMLVGDSAGIEYDSGLDKKINKDRVRDTLVIKTARKLQKQLNAEKNGDEETPVAKPEIEKEEKTQEEPKGLMGRRVA